MSISTLVIASQTVIQEIHTSAIFIRRAGTRLECDLSELEKLFDECRYKIPTNS